MGVDRIKKNLKLDNNDVVEYCKNKISDKNLVLFETEQDAINAGYRKAKR